MDRGDYYEAKCALLNLRTVLLENELRAQKAQAAATAALSRLDVPEAPGHTWDDVTRTITPVEARHGG
jgi:hypothetical protein